MYGTMWNCECSRNCIIIYMWLYGNSEPTERHRLLYMYPKFSENKKKYTSTLEKRALTSNHPHSIHTYFIWLNSLADDMHHMQVIYGMECIPGWVLLVSVSGSSYSLHLCCCGIDRVAIGCIFKIFYFRAKFLCRNFSLFKTNRNKKTLEKRREKKI